jgi:SAM-dependent methyltransferase
MNRRATDLPDQDGIEALRLLLLREGRLPAARAASLCCGTGGLERRLVAQGIVGHCIGYDLAAGAIEVARAEALAAGLGAALDYRRCDLDTTGLGEAGLDLVVGCQGVHHIERLEFAFDNVRAALRPGGLFHLEQEFVGPDRFQWTDRQVEEMTAWLRSLPERYRRTMDGLVKEAAGRATLAEMLAHDPTEAARSSMIEPLLAARFEIVRRRALGGTLTMMALAGIAHNFDPSIPEDVAHLRRLLDCEAALMASGEIGSDFVTITARRPWDPATP